MPIWLISFLFAIGASAWVYGRFMKTTGSNAEASIAVAVMVFLILFATIWSALSLFM